MPRPIRSQLSRVVLGLVTVGSGGGLSSGCATPRAAIVAGSVAVIAGGAMIASQPSTTPCDPPAYPAGCGPDLQGFANAFSSLLGGTLIAIGSGLVLGGGIGLRMERTSAPAAPPPRSTEPVAVASPAPPPVAAEPAALPPATLPPATLPPATLPVERIALQLSVAARAGHCQSATRLARSLAERDAVRIQALIDRDAEVARCLRDRQDLAPSGRAAAPGG